MDSQQRANSTRRSSGRSSKSPDSASEPRHELIGPLTEVALRLRFIYAASVTAALALRALNGEQDAEVADCLRTGATTSPRVRKFVDRVPPPRTERKWIAEQIRTRGERAGERKIERAGELTSAVLRSGESRTSAAGDTLGRRFSRAP